MSVSIDAEKVAQAVIEEAKKVRGLVRIAARAAAYRLKAHLIQKTDELGVTDRGVYKNSFVVNDMTVSNEAPHAGIVEEGSRPHHVGVDGRLALKGWCMRKLGLSEAEAEHASWAIAHKIAEVGTKGHHVFEDSMPLAYEFFQQEYHALLARSQT